ncbi:MAG: TolC family protein [Candidatus Hydrogenedentes bacterium]|nr:TolC family protein [Candidatus Hydrogenedentota bacterium]
MTASPLGILLPFSFAVLPLVLSASLPGAAAEAPDSLTLPGETTGQPVPGPDSSSSIRSEVEVTLLDMQSLLNAVRLEGEQVVAVVSLEEAIATAMKQNPSLLVASIEPQLAGESVKAAKGDFDPRVRSSVEMGESDTDQEQRRSLLDIAGDVGPYPGVSVDDSSRTLEVGIGGKLFTGLQYDVSAVRSTTDRDINTPGGDSTTDKDTVALTLTQPLLRGAGIQVNRAEILKARQNTAASEADLYLQQQNTVADTIGAYWQLVGAFAAVKVRESAVQTAEQLLADTRQRNELGASSDLETLTAQSALARRQNDLISAFADAGRASDHLKGILDLRRDGIMESAMLTPVTPLAGIDLDQLRQTGHLDERILAAWDQRPELHIKDAQAAIAQITLRQRRNARFPSLDLVGQYGWRDTDEDYNGIVAGDTSEDGEFWSLAMKASAPIGNRRARAEYRSAQLRQDQVGREKQQLRTYIAEDLRQSMRETSKYVVLVENARKTVELERVRFQAEQERYHFGTSTAFHLVQVQDDLIAEETRLAQAEAALLAAQADLQRAEGTLLSDLGLGMMAERVQDSTGVTIDKTAGGE